MAVSVRPPATRPMGRSVPEQLVGILRELRSEGLDFERAWVEAMGRVCWPKSGRETKAWREVLEDTVHAWRARYEGWAPLPQEIACAALFEVLRSRQGYLQ